MGEGPNGDDALIDRDFARRIFGYKALTIGRQSVFGRILFGKALCLVAVAALVGPAAASRHAIVLVDPAKPLGKDWAEKAFGNKTNYRTVVIDGRGTIEASGRSSASGLLREVRVHVREYPILHWSWRVDRLPSGADIRQAKSDDYGALLMLLFGRPGLMGEEPPTLSYAWTGGTSLSGTVVPSPRHPESMRTIVLRDGQQDLGRFVTERRDLMADYRAAFGSEPPDDIEAVALWSDSDQTEAEVLAYYGEVTASRE
jgi:hypothetical protein